MKKNDGLEQWFKRRRNGKLRCFRIINKNKQQGWYYKFPPSWVIERGSVLQDVQLNKNTKKVCARGVAFATAAWASACVKFVLEDVWLCELTERGEKDAVIPSAMDGKFRTTEVRLIRKITEKELRKYVIQEEKKKREGE